MLASINTCIDAFTSALRPPETPCVSKWAEDNYELSSEYSSATGLIRLYPYQREPLDSLGADSDVNKLVLMCSSQVMKTLTMQIFTAYMIAVDPGPTLFVEPKDDMAESLSKEKIDPMLRDVKALQGLIHERKSRDSGNTIAMKRFRGGYLAMVGAQRPENGSMRSIRNLFMDEVSRYETSKKEGDFCVIAEKRAVSTYWNHRIIYASSPTLEGACRISAEWDLSDQRRFFVPCLSCGHMQTLVWGNREYGVTWGEQPDGRFIEPDDAHYKCIACGHLHPESDKWEMIERGEYRAAYPGRKIRGYHISQLYTPARSWGSCAVEFLAAGNDPTKLQPFVNTVLGEAFRPQGEAPDFEKLMGRVEDYSLGIVPRGVAFLTGSIDVQANRLEMAVHGHGRRRQRWLVDYVVIYGDPTRQDVWDQLSEAVAASYQCEDGGEMWLTRYGIDSGHLAYDVYRWARTQDPNRCLVLKGYNSGLSLLGRPTDAEIDFAGKKIPAGVKVYPVQTHMGKGTFYGQLKIQRTEQGEYPAGYYHIPAHGWQPEMPLENYCKGATAEEQVTKTGKNGFKHIEWVKIRERNEPLDLNCYDLAVVDPITSRMSESDWDRLEAMQSGRKEQAASVVTKQPEPEPAEAPAPKPAARPAEPEQQVAVSSSWMRNFLG